MSRPYNLSIDINLVRRRISELTLREWTEAGIVAWLTAHGFRQTDNGWRALDYSDLALLERDEVSLLEPVDAGDLDEEDDPSATVESGFESRAATELPGRSDPAREIAVPRCLIGSYRQVTFRWRAVVDRAFEAGSWNEALSGEEMTVLGAGSGIVLGHPSAFLGYQHLHASPIIDELKKVWPPSTGEQAHRRYVDLVAAGTRYFWFVAGILAQDQQPLLPPHFPPERERIAVNSAILRGIRHWWDLLCGVETRFTTDGYLRSPWPEWAGQVTLLLREIGMPRERVVSFVKTTRTDAARILDQCLATVGHETGTGT